MRGSTTRAGPTVHRAPQAAADSTETRDSPHLGAIAHGIRERVPTTLRFTHHGIGVCQHMPREQDHVQR